MSEEQADAIAEAMGGNAWQSGGNIWLVLFTKPNGHIVCISDEAIGEYASQEDFDQGTDLKMIYLCDDINA